MPTYDYLCETNGQKLAVRHAMNQEVHSWGELCTLAGIEPGATPAETPVRKLITGGAVINSGSLANPEPACATGSCCPSGVCGLD